MLALLIFRLVRLLRRPRASVLSRRQRESQNNFAGLHSRLRRENHLRALMLSQRHFKGDR